MAPPPQHMPGVWVCKHRNAPGHPITHTKISTGGWILFAVLLLVCFPLCFIGLTMKEHTKLCGKCFTPAGPGF